MNTPYTMKATRHLCIALSAAIGAATLTACQDEELTKPSTPHVIQVSLCPQDADSVAASAPARELMRTMVITDDSLLMHEFVSDNLTQPLPFVGDAADTRGTVVTTGNIAAEYGSFGMEGFIDNYGSIPTAELGDFNLTGSDQYISGGQCAYSSTTRNWTLTDGSGNAYPWHAGYTYTFWSYAPRSHAGTFSYGSAGSRGTMSVTGYVNPTDAKDQKDLLVAYNNRPFGSTNTSETVDITFRHALAVVTFDISAILTNYTVTKIEIVNAYGQGTCAVKGSDLADSDVTKAFTWSSHSTKTTFAMSDGFAAAGTTDHFFMIPQTLPSDATIKITVIKKGQVDAVVWEKPLATTWQAGKIYEHTLTYDPSTYGFSLTTTGTGTPKFTDKNTAGDVTKYVEITSTKAVGSASPANWDYWDIAGYQIGSGSEVPVETSATSVTVEGLVLSEDLTNRRLQIVSKKWEPIDRGNNDYWTNKDGVSGDTDGSGWSPVSLSSTTYTQTSPLDLSKYDIAEKHTYPTSMNTANCYIVRHAGWYKIPLVYGNAISGGSTNERAYKPGVGLSPFVHHLDKNIIDPFIENNTSDGTAKWYTNSSKYNTFLTAGSAKVLWQDQDAVITNVELIGTAIPRAKTDVNASATKYTTSTVRYIRFYVDPAKICQNNAVIALYDGTGGTGNIMWSWHIWTTNDPALLDSDTGIPVKNYTNNEYDFFPLYELGWVEDGYYEEREQVTVTLKQKNSGETLTVTIDQTAPDMLHSTGVLYQWGRKDPTPASDGTVAGFSASSTSYGVTLGTAIQNPGKFYTRAGAWCSSSYYNLWTGTTNSGASTLTNSSNTATTKTIYDPSPVGYKVPSIYAYTGFSKDGVSHSTATTANFNVPSGTTFSYGWEFNCDGHNGGSTSMGTIFFPATGWRENNTSSSMAGELNNSTDGDGNYHSAFLVDSGGMMNYFAFGKDNIYLTNRQNQTLGAAVRPVKE